MAEFDFLSLTRYVVASDSLLDSSLGYARRVLFCTRTGRPLVVSESLWRMLAAHQWADIPANVIQALVAEGILVDKREDELSAVIRENQEAIRSNEQLYHVIQPTAACQLGCGYCGQEHSPQRMSHADQASLLDRLRSRMASGRYSALAICWFGAEPLLGLSVIRELTPEIRRLAFEQRASYSARIVTNGVRLTPSVAFELSEQLGVKEAEVTLDGPPDIHDQRRATKKGQPSFATIFANLSAIRDRPDIGLGLVVRCNVDRQNFAYVSELIDLIADNGLQQRMSFYVSPVYSWGNDADSGALPAEEFGRWEVEWLAHLHNRGFKAGLLPPRKKIVCLAVHEEGELTDAFGTVFNCTEVSYVASYGRPNLYAIGGTTTNGPRAAPFRLFNQEILGGEHHLCRSCPMLPVCGGSCPKLWSEGKIPCPSVKSNIRERLALWYALQKEHPREAQVPAYAPAHL